MSRSAAIMLFALAGCGGAAVVPNPEPVEVTVHVTHAGDPVSDVNFNLQPTGAGLPAVVAVKDGELKAKVTPGNYTWYITQASADGSGQKFAAIPAAYLEGSMARQVEVAATGGTLHIDLVEEE